MQTKKRPDLYRLMRYKLKNTSQPTRHESLFMRALAEVKNEMVSEGIYIGRIITQKIFLSQSDQHAYLADFFLPSLRLVFEVDGATHDNTQHYDARRTEFIQQRRSVVVRFKNAETEHHTQIKNKIKSAIRNRYSQLGNTANISVSIKIEMDKTMDQAMRDFILNGGQIKVIPAKTRRNRL